MYWSAMIKIFMSEPKDARKSMTCRHVNNTPKDSYREEFRNVISSCLQANSYY